MTESIKNNNRLARGQQRLFAEYRYTIHERLPPSLCPPRVVVLQVRQGLLQLRHPQGTVAGLLPSDVCCRHNGGLMPPLDRLVIPLLGGLDISLAALRLGVQQALLVPPRFTWTSISLVRDSASRRVTRDLYLLFGVLVHHGVHVAAPPQVMHHGLQHKVLARDTQVNWSDSTRLMNRVLHTWTVEALKCIPLHLVQQDSWASCPKRARLACSRAAS